MWKWIGGIVAAVLTSVLTWWLTQGVSRVAIPPPQPPAGHIVPNTPAGVGACATGAAPDNSFHNAPASNGSWDWNCDGQEEHEWGTCESLTKAQCDPNTNVTKSPPGFCSEIRAAAGCVPKVASCGTSGWVYPCFYNQADGRCHAGGYETAAIVRCK